VPEHLFGLFAIPLLTTVSFFARPAQAEEQDQSIFLVAFFEHIITGFLAFSTVILSR